MPEEYVLEEKKALMEQVKAMENNAPETERALVGDDEIFQG